jgi:NADH-quinone oxidoreductase E subunit
MKKTSGGIATQRKDQANLLILLKEAQSRLGYLPREVLKEFADSHGVSISELFGVASFYSFLYTRPKGRYVIRICKSLPCFINNSEMIVKAVEQEIGIKPGETTEDGKFSFELTNCIGACDQAPAMMINSEVYGDLTPEKISSLLKSLD